MRDLEAFGAPGEITGRFKSGERGRFGIWRGNWPAADLFFACATQWRHAGMAGIATGLDYDGVAATARLSGRELTAEIFSGIQIMELAALDEWSRQRERTGARP